MKIDIETGPSTQKPAALWCFLSIRRCVALLFSLLIIVCLLLLFKRYIKFVLIWLENQDSFTISAVVCLLFILVSLPVSIGYIILVVASGYLFGVRRGLLLTVAGANFGLFVAHNLLRMLGHHHAVYRFTQNMTAQAIMRVINGPLCFKIVICARLTPIPFGLQNTIFALSDVKGLIYHVASFIGLLPAQLVAVYVGSTLRSMQDVLENRQISTSAYVIVFIQVIFGASLIIWLGTKARKELVKALSEASSTPCTKVVDYNNIV